MSYRAYNAAKERKQKHHMTVKRNPAMCVGVQQHDRLSKCAKYTIATPERMRITNISNFYNAVRDPNPPT